VKNQTWFDPTIVSGMAPAMDEATLSATANGPKSKYLSRELAASFQRDLSLRRLEAGMGGETPAQRTKSLDKEISYLKEMHAAGVRFLAGTDLAALLVFPGFSLHDELELLVARIGLTPMEALISATRHPAEFFKIQDSLGTVTTGKIADLVLLDGNPLENIRNVRRIEAVLVNGKLIERDELARMLH
jgi:imidazolonepropionase-like amidohydrolase